LAEDQRHAESRTTTIEKSEKSAPADEGERTNARREGGGEDDRWMDHPRRRQARSGVRDEQHVIARAALAHQRFTGLAGGVGDTNVARSG